MYGDDSDKLNDGPYIFRVSNKLKVKWIENNRCRQENILPDNYFEIKKKFKLLCDYDDLKNSFLQGPEYQPSYEMVDSIAVLSDIHGEFNTYVNLLTAMRVIDDERNWKFGNGHLVVIGDIIDRGSNVTEVLWHLFGLEKQALKAGGMVHVLLGNHECMVLSRNLSYISEKYKSVEAICNTNYYDLFSERSVLGIWLRSKPVMITINSIIFVHGGVSPEMVNRNLTIDQINRKFSDKIIGKDPELVENDKELAFLNKEKGPIWYRGYFTDTSLCESNIDSILKFYHKDHIVIGHTPNEGIKSLFNNKVIGIHAGIMYKEPEEMLLFKDGSFYRGLNTGERIKIH